MIEAAAISMAAESTPLELNMAEPIIAFDLLSGLTMLGNACLVLATRCVSGITANRDVCRGYVERSIGLVTALNPVLGYERSVSIAKEAMETGSRAHDLVVEKGWLSKERLQELLDPANVTNPRDWLPSRTESPDASADARRALARVIGRVLSRALYPPGVVTLGT